MDDQSDNDEADSYPSPIPQGSQIVDATTRTGLNKRQERAPLSHLVIKCSLRPKPGSLLDDPSLLPANGHPKTATNKVMASVTSLGLHQPTALPYLIQERLLPQDANPDSYTWQTLPCSDGQTSGDDELVTTKTSVIWSRGGIVRKSFRFEVEDEPVHQALLTNFYPESARRKKQGDKETEEVDESKRREAEREAYRQSRALVVFLRTQAHIYYLSGASHIVHLPFEVEYAAAAPNGVILQRKVKSEKGNPLAASIRVPRAPANSFIASQQPIWSGTSSVQSTFSTVGLNSPIQLEIPQPSIWDDLWPTDNATDKEGPRLFSLTDPLAEVGLVVTGKKANAYRKSSLKAVALDNHEEIVHISPSLDGSTSLTFDPARPSLAVTMNKETMMYTIWRVEYVRQEDELSVKPARRESIVNGGKQPRRKSSYLPPGATTPRTESPAMFRESLGGAENQGTQKMRRKNSVKEKKLDFEKSLDPDAEQNSTPSRRKSRRVSSMLARADLSMSASHDRGGGLFADYTSSQHPITRAKSNSSASLHGRASFAGYGKSFRNSLSVHPLGQSTNSFLETPVDNLLDGLKAGGDFEGFGGMDLEDEDYEGMRKEIVFTMIDSIPIRNDNVHFSTSQKPAHTQCRAFVIAGPEDNPERRQVVVCIQDHLERKFICATLNICTNKGSTSSQPKGRRQELSGATETIRIVPKDVVRGDNVVDACKVQDWNVSRILLLTEADGDRWLSLQSPWGVLMNISYPADFLANNLRGFGFDAHGRASRQAVAARLVDDPPTAFKALKSPLPGGLVDIVDAQGRFHQLRIRMEPRVPIVKRAIETCRYVLMGKLGDTFLVGWWNVQQWLHQNSSSDENKEYSALVITLFSLILQFRESRPLPLRTRHQGNKSSLSKSISTVPGAATDLDHILDLQSINGNPSSTWAQTTGWKWLEEEGSSHPSTPADPRDVQDFSGGPTFIQRHVALATEFLKSPVGKGTDGFRNMMPGGQKQASVESFEVIITKVMRALHLIHEDSKLDITLADSLVVGNPSLAPLLCQMCRWLGWKKWAAAFDMEDAVMDTILYDSGTSFLLKIHDYFNNVVSVKILSVQEPGDIPNIHGWIGSGLVGNGTTLYPTLADIKYGKQGVTASGIDKEEQCSILTPRTALFKRLSEIAEDKSPLVRSRPSSIVEAICKAGFTNHILDTLPEAILVPFREAITACQSEPAISWGKKLLTLVGREDVNMLLFSKKDRLAHTSLLVPTHEASNDVVNICAALTDPEAVGSFDGSAEVDRQAITRLIFKEDQRFSEAARILNTQKPTVARCIPNPNWTESDLLEAQKVITQDLAIRTLSIPPGRGLLYFSARVPLLTEKFPIGGFNMHCVFKPTNNTVAVDKSAFTEEKICWSFFHLGVSAGLTISRHAKGIDTSWILYNKPVELSNRHAGFLLALGLNGHLKCVAKWVAFKYLTPKHTMTSIGLLLGLAASYMGTMDSLITRLLSVHVTRMLPPGAAELNLSPLTQTTGIMGIGLLYCNTSHRRMSEIMLSETERTDLEELEEPLRNEGYRLAAGFALGFINLGKGGDLRGLHDMHVTERLLKLAIGSKKIELVHVLDKATAGAMIAIALIFMKSEDQQLARKLEVPKSELQFGYVRPDIFLLRTLARNLILWSQIKPSKTWIKTNLPPTYRHNSDLTKVVVLRSEDLPFYNIVAGLCFSIALRYSGSGDMHVRDLLVHYLDELMRLCNLPVITFDQQLTRNTARNCMDLLALCCATVMSGTGDLIVFRRLRALRGRDDAHTLYGSHMAANIAIGALFLAGGTHTFGTSNVAIASLIVAFYPIYPTSILDNKSHLQAFRHFWVLATEARCVVARDVETNLPVSLPLQITLRPKRNPMDDMGPLSKLAPCLLPDIDDIASLTTSSREFWGVSLNFDQNPDHLSAFKRAMTVYVKRRPAYDAKQGVFHATLQALDEGSGSARQPLEWIWELEAFKSFTSAERALVLPSGEKPVARGMEGTLVDTRLVLEKATLESGNRGRLEGLRELFGWAEGMREAEREPEWIRREVVEALRARVWGMSMVDEEGVAAAASDKGVGLGLS